LSPLFCFWGKTWKLFAPVIVNFSKIGQNITSVYIFLLQICGFIWPWPYGEIRDDEQCSLTVLTCWRSPASFNTQFLNWKSNSKSKYVVLFYKQIKGGLLLHVNFIIIEIIMSLFLCIYFSYDHVLLSNGRLNWQ
jgi:hypothetical protein